MGYIAYMRYPLKERKKERKTISLYWKCNEEHNCNTYGNFILINTNVVKKETRIQINPIEMSIIRLSFGISGSSVLSKMTNPNEPTVKRKLAANPSMMYCPLTR